MRRISAILLCMVGLAACDKHDPILPGTRTAIFDTGTVTVMNTEIADLSPVARVFDVAPCPYVQDASNVVWDGDKRIFSGFPVSNAVKNDAHPVCGGGFVYAGLTTGELVKINPKAHRAIWVADIYRDSYVTGGSSMLDIIAPITLDGGAIYVGGLGDAFCRINADNGGKKWCVNIGTALPYVIVDNAIFVVATDGNLYALRTTDGAVFWRTEIKRASAPEYADGVITVGREKINAKNGTKIK